MQKPTDEEKIQEQSSAPEQEPVVEQPESELQELAKRYSAEFGPSGNERRQPTVFAVEDFSFRSSSPSSTHWSIGWSDLMMTMFILFLTLFVYQATHKKLLFSEQTEVVGGETTNAVDVAPPNTPTAHFAPIKPSLPLITSGTIKKVIPIHVEDIGADTKFFSPEDKERLERAKGSSTPSAAEKKTQERQVKRAEEEAFMGFMRDRKTTKPNATMSNKQTSSPTDKIHRLFGRIKNTITRYNLSPYASVSLMPGEKSILIVLTSDLFFDKGKGELTPNSKMSLQKIGNAIKETPFMIDIIGHTDDRQRHDKRFPSNWELSAARASSIARFFIEETEMNPNQFVVSGFSSYRPLYPNTTAHNRAANRRIDVIISNHFPESVSAQ